MAKREAAKVGARVHILKSCGAAAARALLADVVDGKTTLSVASA
jgi:hypothetical protein